MEPAPARNILVYTLPSGFLLTWTTFGTWLHGDERGSVRRELKKHGWPKIEADPVMLQTMRRKLSQEPFLIKPGARGVIEDTITEVCEHRGWYLHAFNVRTNHVHVVVTGGVSPRKMSGDIKAYCTRHLRRLEIISADRRVWTDGGSTRYLWNADDLGAAIDYVRNRQGPGLER